MTPDLQKEYLMTVRQLIGTIHIDVAECAKQGIPATDVLIMCGEKIEQIAKQLVTESLTLSDDYEQKNETPLVNKKTKDVAKFLLSNRSRLSTPVTRSDIRKMLRGSTKSKLENIEIMIELKLIEKTHVLGGVDYWMINQDECFKYCPECH